MSNTKEMKLLIEGFNKFLNEATESREFAPTTGEVDFEWGTYTSTAKDEKYFIMNGEDLLGKIQKPGDPFTYNDAGNDRATIVSAPESRKSSIGASVDIADITNKQTGSDKESESDSESEKKAADAAQASANSFVNAITNKLVRLTKLYDNYDAVVESNKETLSKKMTSGEKNQKSHYNALTRNPGWTVPRRSEWKSIYKSLTEDIITAQKAVILLEKEVKKDIEAAHMKLDDYVEALKVWAMDVTLNEDNEDVAGGGDAAFEKRAFELMYPDLNELISKFLLALAKHPALRLTEGLDQKSYELRVSYMWNLEGRQDISLNAALTIANPYSEDTADAVKVMLDPRVPPDKFAGPVKQTHFF